jgi:glycosyltransferase involved in cell wall biosynthesis
MITFVTWRYKKTHPKVKLIWPSMENRPIGEKFSWLENKLLSLWTMIYGRSSDLIMYLNKGARQNLIEAGVPEAKLRNVMWATWGIDCEEFSPTTNANNELNANNEFAIRMPFAIGKVKPKVILFVGKVSEAKGVPWLLEAFEDVRSKIKDVRLVLVGPMDRNLESRIKNLESAEYLGIIKNQDLPDLFRQVDVVVAPSITTKTWEEQVGMVNLQTMACGIPVITTRSGAIPEFVKDGEGAILVPEKDSETITKALIDLLTHDQTRLSLGKQAREFICRNYEVKENIKKVEGMLETL